MDGINKHLVAHLRTLHSAAHDLRCTIESVCCDNAAKRDRLNRELDSIVAMMSLTISMHIKDTDEDDGGVL